MTTVTGGQNGASIVVGQSSPYVTRLPTGWTCYRCGCWVGEGCAHHCPSTSIFSNPPLRPSLPLGPHERTAAAADRVRMRVPKP